MTPRRSTHINLLVPQSTGTQILQVIKLTSSPPIRSWTKGSLHSLCSTPKRLKARCLHADRHTLLALPRGRPEAGRTGRAATSARSAVMTLAISPTVVASPARTGACGTETGTADDTHGARGGKGGLISAPGRLIRASPGCSVPVWVSQHHRATTDLTLNLSCVNPLP